MSLPPTSYFLVDEPLFVDELFLVDEPFVVDDPVLPDDLPVGGCFVVAPDFCWVVFCCVVTGG